MTTSNENTTTGVDFVADLHAGDKSVEFTTVANLLQLWYRCRWGQSKTNARVCMESISSYCVCLRFLGEEKEVRREHKGLTIDYTPRIRLNLREWDTSPVAAVTHVFRLDYAGDHSGLWLSDKILGANWAVFRFPHTFHGKNTKRHFNELDKSFDKALVEVKNKIDKFYMEAL